MDLAVQVVDDVARQNPPAESDATHQHTDSTQIGAVRDIAQLIAPHSRKSDQVAKRRRDAAVELVAAKV
jgi:hypothetical protein